MQTSRECLSLSCIPLLTSYDMCQLPGRGHQQNPVMPSVRYGQPFLAVVHSHLPRKRQDAGWQGVSVQLDPHWVRLQHAPLPVVTEGAIGKKRQPVAVAFAHKGEEQVAARSKQDQRGPAGHFQFMPEVRLAVVHHWVADVIAENSTANIVQDLWRVGYKHRKMSKEPWTYTILIL